MSVKKSARRTSLLASSSLVAAGLIAGVAGLSSLAVAPGVAFAADECGNPSANGGAQDVFTCAGAYVGIDYTATANGTLVLNLEDGVTVTNGIAVNGTAGNSILIHATTNVVGGGDPSILNGAGYAINLVGNGGLVLADLRTSDLGVDGAPGPAVGGARGIRAVNAGGNAEIRMNEGVITTTAGFGAIAQATGGNTMITLTNGATVNSSGTAVYGSASGGTVFIQTSGLITSAATGIYGNGSAGTTIIAGPINATGGAAIDASSGGGAVSVTTLDSVSGLSGIDASASGGNAVSVVTGGSVTGTAGNGITTNASAGLTTIDSTAGSVTATGVGVSATATGNGAINIDTADVTGAGGVSATANGTGAVDIDTTAGTINGTTGTGINASAGNGGVVITAADVSGLAGINVATTGSGAATVTSTGTVTATGDVGVNVDAGGAVNITVNNVNATGDYGVVGISNTGGSTATVSAGGTVVGDGGVAVQTNGTGDALVTLGAGSNVTATDPLLYGVFSGAVGTGNATADLGGNVLDGGVGVFTGAGDATVSGAGNVTMSTTFDAVTASSTTGQVSVSLSGDITSADRNAINAGSTTGDIDVTTSGGLSAGANGILAASTSGAVTINTLGGTIGSTTAGINASSAGAIDINNAAVITAGTTGITATGSGGVDINTSANVTGATGISATGTGTGAATVTVQATSTVTGTAGDGVSATATSGSVTVTANNTIDATGGNGISASTSAGGAISVSGSGAILGGANYGILATASAGGDIGITYSGDIGAVGNPTSSGGVLALISGGAGDVGVSVTSDVYTDGAGLFGAGVAGANQGTAGSVTVSFDGTMVSGTVGVAGGIYGATNGDAVAVSVADGSSITAGNIGVLAYNFGAGSASAQIGAGVTIDPDDVGVDVFSALSDATATTGAGSTIIITNTDLDNIAYGIRAQSGAAADAAVGDEAVEITVGANNTITIDDGAAGDADGAAGVYGEATGAAGSVSIATGAGLNIAITGNGALGIGGITDGGDVSIVSQTGLISVIGLDGVDGAGNFPGTAGIAGISTSGDVLINSATTIEVDSGLLDAAGIYAESGASGSVTVLNTGDITSSQDGIATAAVDGNTYVETSGTILSTTDSIYAESTGTGGIQLVNSGALTSTTGNGISAENSGAGGAIVISSTGPTITAGQTGISALNVNGASAGVIQVTNSADINANTAVGVGSGIVAVQNGTGGVTIINSGDIAGSAFSGILATDNSVGGLGVSIGNTGAIGSALDPVSNVGISGVSFDGGVNIQSTDGGGIFAGNIGISAANFGAGGVQVFTSATSPITTSNVGSIGISASGNGGLTEVANNAAINSAGDGIVATNVAGTLNVGSSGAVAATGGDAIRTSNTTGDTTILTTASGTLNASDDGIDASSTSGLIDIDTAAAIVAGDVGIQAAASGAGVITVNTAAGSTINAVGDGINASSVGGNVTVATLATVTSTGGDGIEAGADGGTLQVTNGAAVSGAANGILTSNSGTGTTTVNANANVTGTGAGAAAINTATTGTGATTVAIANGLTVQNVNGSAIRTASAGGAVGINTGTGSTIVGAGAGATSWVVDMANSGAGVSTLTIGSGTTVRSTDNTVTGYDDAAIRAVGGSVVVSNAGRINGRVAFSGVTGTAAMTNTGVWHTTGASTFGPGADSLTNSATGSIFTNAGGVATSFDFGAGADTFTNAGLLVVGEPAQAASTLTITGLETWNNSGRIVFGSSGTTLTAVSDGQINDRILASGTTFTGSGSSRLVMDANLGATTQTSCASLTAADCLSLTGGSTAGSTLILVNDVSPNAFGALNTTGIVLVDVSGAGSTAATNFSLDPNSDYWRADGNSADGVLDKGLFFYDLTLNGNKQHVLVGLPDREAFEFTTFGTAAQNIWYSTTGVWHERQADVRDQLPGIDGNGAGVWVKVAGGMADRDRINSYSLFGTTYSFDTSYSQDTAALIGGLDFVGGNSDAAWLIGGQVGYVDSDVTYDTSPTLTSFKGMTLGLYGSYVAGPIFIDGIVNANQLDYEHQAVTLAPVGSNIFTGSLDSLGFQVEGGYSFPLGENGFFEPSALVSYVTTSIDTVSVPGADIVFDDQTSLRAALGGRIGVNADHGTFSSKWSLVARYWNEFEGDNQLVIQSAGPDLGLNDDFSGGFGEVAGTVNVFSADDRFSAFLNLGVKFKDDYQSTDGSLGIRWRW